MEIFFIYIYSRFKKVNTLFRLTPTPHTYTLTSGNLNTLAILIIIIMGLILFQICVQTELLFHETAWNMGNETLHLLYTVGTLLVQILKFRLGYKATETWFKIKDPFHRPSFGITFTQTNSLPCVLYNRPCFLVLAGPCCCQVTDRCDCSYLLHLHHIQSMLSTMGVTGPAVWPLLLPGVIVAICCTGSEVTCHQYYPQPKMLVMSNWLVVRWVTLHMLKSVLSLVSQNNINKIIFFSIFISYWYLPVWPPSSLASFSAWQPPSCILSSLNQTSAKI